MVSLDQYQAYRKAARELNHQIMDALMERPVLMRAGRALDVARGDTFVFESEAEMNVLMDYALYEYRQRGRSLVQLYQEQTPSLSPMQRELLDGMCQSYTSLFRITEVLADESTLVLADRLQQRADIPLIDIMFSRTVEPGMLVFTRVIPLSMMNMTAGIAFVFPGDSEASLLRRYKRLSKRVKADAESAPRSSNARHNDKGARGRRPDPSSLDGRPWRGPQECRARRLRQYSPSFSTSRSNGCRQRPLRSTRTWSSCSSTA